VPGSSRLLGSMPYRDLHQRDPGPLRRSKGRGTRAGAVRTGQRLWLLPHWQLPTDTACLRYRRLDEQRRRSSAEGSFGGCACAVEDAGRGADVHVEGDAVVGMPGHPRHVGGVELPGKQRRGTEDVQGSGPVTRTRYRFVLSAFRCHRGRWASSRPQRPRVPPRTGRAQRVGSRPA
jgi:hypothetical protein